MSQQLSKKEGYRHLVEYIGSQESSKKLARLNVLIDLGYLDGSHADIILLKKNLIEEGLSYFMTKIATEITHLGSMLGDQRKHIKGSK